MSLEGPRCLLKEVLDATTEGQTVIRKGAQIGGTDTVTFTRALHHLDLFRTDLLYLFPTQEIASEFSSGRFNPLLDRNPYLRGLFTEVDNVHHKRAGQANFYVRGSNSQAQLISVPVEGLIVDEFDRMNLNNLGLARDRQMAKHHTFEIDISTPTFPGLGIDAEFAKSDKREWLCECPNCRERRPMSQSSLFFTEAAPDLAVWGCSACGMPWTQDKKNEIVSRGTWVSGNPGAKVKGFHLPALLSPVKQANYYADRWVSSMSSETQVQIYHNSVLGNAYSAEGMQVTEELMTKAQQAASYRMSLDGKWTCMGVDIGSLQHYVIAEKKEDGSLRVLRAGAVANIDDIENLIEKYDVKCCVIDANPERQKVRDLMIRVNRKRMLCVWMAFYPEIKEPAKWDRSIGKLDLNRTDIIDTMVGRFISGRILLPLDIPTDYRIHLRSIVRVNEIDKRTGNAIGRWKESGPDHYAHAQSYCEAASQRIATGAAQLGLYVL